MSDLFNALSVDRSLLADLIGLAIIFALIAGCATWGWLLIRPEVEDDLQHAGADEGGVVHRASVLGREGAQDHAA